MLQEYLNNLNLNIGESHRGDCPVCNHNNTFSVTNSGTRLLYNCYHSDCSISGFNNNKITKEIFNSIINNSEQINVDTEYKIPDYKEGFMEKPELTDKQSETSDYLNNLQNSLENNQLENRYDIGKNNIIMLKKYKTDDIIFGEDKQKNSKNVFYDSGFNFFEKQKWDSLKKRFLSILSSVLQIGMCPYSFLNL